MITARTYGSLSQLTAIDSGGQVTLFAIDGDTLVRAEASADVTMLDAFVVVPLGKPLIRPLLSNAEERLFILDSNSGTIIELDAIKADVVSQRTINRTEGAHAFAVTSQFFAIAGQSVPGISIFDRVKDELVATVSTETVVCQIEPLPYDRFAVTYAGHPRVDELRRAGDTWNKVPLRISDEETSSDFTQYEGIYYLLRNDKVFVRAKSTTDVSPGRRLLEVPSALEVVATRDFLFVNEGASIRRFDRTEPITISVQDINGRNGPAIVEIYRYLAQAGLVSHKPLTVTRFKDFDDVLAATSTGAPWWDSTFLSAAETDALAATICRVNENACHNVATLVQWLNGAKPVQITVPDLDVSIETLTRTRQLGSVPASDYLRQLPMDVRGNTTAADIVRVNPSAISPFEYELVSRGFALLPVASFNATAGSTIQLTPMTIRPVKTDCTATTENVGIVRLDLPQSLESQRPAAVLPPVKNRLSEKKLRSFGIHTVRVAFDEAGVEGVDGMQAPQWESDPRCAAVFERATLVVSRAARLDQVRFQLLDDDGEVLTVTAADLQALNLDLRPEGTWLYPRYPSMYVGYRAFRSAGKGVLIDATPPLDETLLAKQKADLRLPLAAWSVSTFARSRDLEMESSALYNFSAKSAFVLPRREIFSRAESVETVPLQDGMDDGVRIRDNRMKHVKSIHYQPPTALAYTEAIAIAEACDSIDFQHPDFGSGEAYAWITSPPCHKSFASTQRLLRDEFDIGADHGSHVAGLIAARPGSPVQGLLPAARLEFIERTGAPEVIVGRFEKAMKNLTIVSCSLSWENTSTLKLSLKSIMGSPGWSTQLLFVVAAGSRGVPVRDEDDAPVLWVNELSNVITVGASDFSHRRFIGTTQTPKGPKAVGSNYGKDYVEIFAPAVDVISTASGSAYAPASGSSQAVPFVTATAALLSKVTRDPSTIKARLLYTADWWLSLGDDVWAGELNADRALREPEKNVVATQLDCPVTKTECDSYSVASFVGTIVIGKSSTRERRGPNQPNVLPRPKSLDITTEVLRIQLQRDGSFRIFYRDADSTQLRILENASISGRLTCEAGAGDPLCDSTGTFEAAEISDYVARFPTKRITF